MVSHKRIGWKTLVCFHEAHITSRPPIPRRGILRLSKTLINVLYLVFRYMILYAINYTTVFPAVFEWADLLDTFSFIDTAYTLYISAWVRILGAHIVCIFYACTVCASVCAYCVCVYVCVYCVHFCFDRIYIFKWS